MLELLGNDNDGHAVVQTLQKWFMFLQSIELAIRDPVIKHQPCRITTSRRVQAGTVEKLIITLSQFPLEKWPWAYSRRLVCRLSCTPLTS